MRAGSRARLPGAPALGYDHRIVDGKEAVIFLARVKKCLEDPQRFVLEP